MHSKTPETRTPLLLWLLLLMVAAALLLASYGFGKVKRRNDFSACASYVLNKFDAAGRQPVILVLGTSLTQCSLDSSAVLEDSIKKLSGKKAVVIKVWMQGTPLRSIMANMPELTRIHPDILVLEANMLTYLPRK